MKEVKPIYVLDVLTGAASLGSLIITEEIRLSNIILIIIVFLSIITSMIVSFQSEKENDRNKKYIEILLRSIELPYFIIKDVTEELKLVLQKENWDILKQENYRNMTIYVIINDRKEEGLLIPESV